MCIDLTGDTALYLRLLRYVVPYWRVFLLSIISMIVLAATDPAIPALMQPMLDGAFIDNDPASMTLIPALFVVLFAIRGVAAYASGGALHWVANRVIMDLRSEMFIRLLNYPSRFYDSHTAGKLISKFTFDVTQIREASTNTLSILVRDTLATLGLIAWMFYKDWQLALIAMASTPLIVVIVLIIKRRLRKMSRKVQESMGEIHHVLDESIEGHKIVKLFSGQSLETRRFADTINANRRYAMKFAMAAIASSPAVQLVTAIVLAVIIYIATNRAVAGVLSVGEFVSFFAAMAMLLGPLKRLVGVNEHIQKGLSACESVFAILDTEIEEDTGKLEIQRASGALEFRNVTFQYEGSDIDAIDDLSICIEPGETIALVGASGSGKTTVANLLARFYLPGKGSILIDGVDLQEIRLQSLRANIAFVSQDVVLFNDTVRNNIAYGAMRDCSYEAIIKSAEAAYAMEFIRKLPAGMDTVIGEGGIKLSGGQMQRLAIARALLKDAPLLILDEATSSLDTESERRIQSALENLTQGRTCIIIAHRLSTIENADRIIVMDKGKIVETGKHHELLKRNNVYARLQQIQFQQDNQQ
jgi:subfamily B ATP-binding cassette protein MsbA